MCTVKERKYKPLNFCDFSEDGDIRDIVYRAANYAYHTIHIVLCSIPRPKSIKNTARMVKVEIQPGTCDEGPEREYRYTCTLY